jgi:hypothetical protein
VAREAIALYIDQVETYKLISRDVARDVARSLDFDALAADPDAHVASLIALLLSYLELRVFRPMVEVTISFMNAVGFTDAPDDALLAALVFEALLDAEFRMITEFDAWATSLARQFDDITGAGLDPTVEQAAVGLLETTATAQLATLLGTASVAVSNDVATAISQEFLVENAGERLLRWGTVEDKRRCVGDFNTACAARHGAVRTLAEWERVGLPNAPNLNCVRWNGAPVCRCVLYPDEFDVGADPIRVARRV